MRAGTARRRTPEGLLVVELGELRPVVVSNDAGDLSDELEAKAVELAERVTDIVADRLRQQLPAVLSENDAAIREIVAGSIKTALADSHVDDRIAQAEEKAGRALVLTAIASAVGAAVLSLLLAEAVR
jgi:hypothetical protein